MRLFSFIAGKTVFSMIFWKGETIAHCGVDLLPSNLGWHWFAASKQLEKDISFKAYLASNYLWCFKVWLQNLMVYLSFSSLNNVQPKYSFFMIFWKGEKIAHCVMDLLPSNRRWHQFASSKQLEKDISFKAYLASNYSWCS